MKLILMWQKILKISSGYRFQEPPRSEMYLPLCKNRAGCRWISPFDWCESFSMIRLATWKRASWQMFFFFSDSCQLTQGTAPYLQWKPHEIQTLANMPLDKSTVLSPETISQETEEIRCAIKDMYLRNSFTELPQKGPTMWKNISGDKNIIIARNVHIWRCRNEILQN